MKVIKLKDAMETLEKLEDEYERLKGLVADQVRDNQIDEAAETFEKIQGMKKAIEQMHNLQVQI